MFKIFVVNFLKTRNFRTARLCLKATIIISHDFPRVEKLSRRRVLGPVRDSLILELLTMDVTKSFKK